MTKLTAAPPPSTVKLLQVKYVSGDAPLAILLNRQPFESRTYNVPDVQRKTICRRRLPEASNPASGKKAPEASESVPSELIVNPDTGATEEK